MPPWPQPSRAGGVEVFTSIDADQGRQFTLASSTPASVATPRGHPGAALVQPPEVFPVGPASPGALDGVRGEAYDRNDFLTSYIDNQPPPPTCPQPSAQLRVMGLAARDPQLENFTTECQAKPARGLPRRTGCAPIPVPDTPGQGWDPMQRWRASPPESEAAPLSAIFDAVQTTQLAQRHSATRSRAESSPSVNSWTQGSISSIASSRSSGSNASRRRRRVAPQSLNIRSRQSRRSSNGTSRRFYCTFCCDTFKTKHDWTRHEQSLHLNCDFWACAPYGGTAVSPLTKRVHCSYCSVLDPTSEHLESHKHGVCRKDQQELFRRKDHLIQHLRGFHQLESIPPVEDWKIKGPVVTSRCGFCDSRLESWEARANHLAEHFRQGKSMDSWVGEHDFEPAIASQVRNSIPPYLVAFESNTQVPFSATDPRTIDHLAQMVRTHGGPSEAEQQPSGNPERTQLIPQEQRGLTVSPSLFTQFLAWHLGRFAQDSVSKGVVPSDQMFQDEARRLVYGSDDNWEQTIADNSMWMAEFRNRHLADVEDPHSNL
ncbi:hypothetical protein Micbo1qcDRAFT_226322 [Microdochium bolleyi]|uniref:C2H2-type domain-containing protein n=1 Tax=Microdochium bolleyi TaxID=196109 RepID=A0A136IZI7_9PEZI|nr:hypothetical protein Micbo1qcDRAFT_226322 [Microdochium bolleyi]